MPTDSLSPLDGRYLEKTKELSVYFSEAALIRYRVFVEIRYLLFLSEKRLTRALSSKEKESLKDISFAFSSSEAEIVKHIEKKTNHDVKAIEYYLKEKLKGTSLADLGEYIHFGLTSEDINNLSYSLMFQDGVQKAYLPALKQVIERVAALAKENKAVPMLSRTHGQAASPTTFGKECAVFLMRLSREYSSLKRMKLYGKLNGAVGNFNAHVAAYPNVDWLKFSEDFVRGIGLEPNLYTTQIEPHDSMAAAFHCLMRINNILLDLSRDFWSYISSENIVQSVKKDEVGSSTMPHKVNPIDFENAEGNMGMANSMMSHMASKLTISRMQRDLSDSTVLRNQGVALGYSLLAMKSLLIGLSKVKANAEKMLHDLDSHPEVLAEAIQTVLRREKAEMPYEQLKELTRGKKVLLSDIERFIKGLTVSEKVKKELFSFRPANYIGSAEKIVDKALKEYKVLVN